MGIAHPQIPRPKPCDNADIAKFILQITEDIWERKNVELIYDCYAEDGPIHTLGGEVIGAEAVVRNTVNTLAAFPDRKMHADGLVIGAEGDAEYYSSHRIGSQMTHLGPGDFGPATGNSAHVVTIADCVVRDYVISKDCAACRPPHRWIIPIIRSPSRACLRRPLSVISGIIVAPGEPVTRMQNRVS